MWWPRSRRRELFNRRQAAPEACGTLPSGISPGRMRQLKYEIGKTYAFTFRGAQEAPNASGVYTIYTSQHWIYAGESDDIRQSLFDHLNQPTACMAGFEPLSFSFELAPPDERIARHQALVAELAPECDRAIASSPRTSVSGAVAGE